MSYRLFDDSAIFRVSTMENKRNGTALLFIIEIDEDPSSH